MGSKYGYNYFDGPESNYGGSYVWGSHWNTKAMNLEICFRPVRVLVAGCAKGFLVEAFFYRFIEAEGFDISQYALDCSAPEIMDRLYLADARDLPFEDEEFDLVVAIDLLEHIEEKTVPKAVSELCRVCYGNIFTRQHFEWNRKSRADPTHVTIKPKEFWIDLFRKNGFRVCDIADEFMGRSDIPDEEWEDPDKEPFNPHEILVFKKWRRDVKK